MFRRMLLGLGLFMAMLGPAAAQNRFSLINNTGEQINQIYVSASRLSNWGRDMLGATVLGAGQSQWIVPDTSDCILDIRVVYSNGRAEERRQVNACTISRLAWGGSPQNLGKGGDPSFRFLNSSGMVVRELYVSLSSDGNWGPDRLGQGVLQPGQSIWVGLPGGRVCQSDIRVVYADGRAEERRRMETCSIAEVSWRG